jgi:hypothetical protein
MPVTRRRLLAVSASSLIAALAAWWSWSRQAAPQQAAPRPVAPTPETRRNAGFRAWIDTLVPAEADFPGAAALGVAERIQELIGEQPAYAALTRAALEWLDERARAQGGDGFAALSEVDRQAIVSAAAASAPGSTQRTFFQATLDDALFHTYANESAWVTLGYAGPPQPIGFPDQQLSPGKR